MVVQTSLSISLSTCPKIQNGEHIFTFVFLSNEDRRLKNFHRIFNNQPLHPLCNSRPLQQILPSPYSKRTIFQDITFVISVLAVSTYLIRIHGYYTGHAIHAAIVFCLAFAVYDIVRPFTIWPVKIAIRIKRRIRS